MIVPGSEIASGTDGVTTSYVIAHEYGHHIAANRSNAPFAAIDYGPKRWASYERVCSRTNDGLLAPGNEGSRYASNPGEAWAETYAQLTYPGVAWSFTSLLRPDAGARTAARSDVLSPWRHGRTRTWRARLGPGTSRRSHRFTVTLDGALSLRLHGPAGANYDLRLSSSDGTGTATSRAGSRDVISHRAACRTGASERLTVTVVRRSGRGPYTLRAAWAG